MGPKKKRDPTLLRQKADSCPSRVDKSASRKAESQQIAVRRLLYWVRHPDWDLGRLRRIRHLHLGADKRWVSLRPAGARYSMSPRRSSAVASPRRASRGRHQTGFSGSKPPYPAVLAGCRLYLGPPRAEALQEVSSHFWAGFWLRGVQS